jgi:hypothetical protein
MLKDKCGVKASYEQIENCTEFIFKKTINDEEDKKKRDIAGKIIDQPFKEKSHEEMINFKFFEQMMKKMLKKAGHKPPVKKRERDEEQKILLPSQTDPINILNDFKDFSNLFFSYHDMLDETSELELVFLPYFSKIIKNVKNNISKGAIGNEVDDALLLFFKNLLTYIGNEKSFMYLLKIFMFILNCFDPDHVLHKKLFFSNLSIDQPVDDNDRILFKKVQLSMDSSGLTEYLVNLISKSSSDQKVKLLYLKI